MLAADVAAAFVPGLTGAGQGVKALYGAEARAVKYFYAGEKRAAQAAMHRNNLNTKAPAQGYTLRDRNTNCVLKYGETTQGTSRYTQKYLDDNNAYMKFEVNGSKREMHDWQNRKINEYKKKNDGARPPLNKSDYD